MRIYFSGAISGGRDNLPIYLHIVTHLKSLGYDVPSANVADPGVLSADGAPPSSLPRFLTAESRVLYSACAE